MHGSNADLPFYYITGGVEIGKDWRRSSVTES